MTYTVNTWQQLVLRFEYIPSPLSDYVLMSIHTGTEGAQYSNHTKNDAIEDYMEFVTQIGGKINTENAVFDGFTGYVYFIYAYNYGLTDAEIASLYNFTQSGCPYFGCLDTFPSSQFAQNQSCNSWCRTCRSSGINSCAACPLPNYYLLDGICVNGCPMTTLLNTTSGNCDSNTTTQTILNYNFTEFRDIQYTTGREAVMTLGYSRIYFPRYDQNDPYLIENRGLYFTGNSFGNFRGYPSGYSTVMLARSHTIGIWAKVVSPGVLISKIYIEYTRETLRFEIDSDRKVSVKTVCYASNGDISYLTVKTNSTVDTAWHHIAYTLTSGKSSVSIRVYIDNVLQSTGATPGFFFDSNPSVMPLGALYTPNGYSTYFTGFIASVTIYPNVTSTFSLSNLPSSSFNYLSTLSGSPCNSHCLYGCVRPTDCVLNFDPLCQSYSNYTVCTSCGADANRWSDGLCHCKYFKHEVVDYSHLSSCRCEETWGECMTCPVFLTGGNVSFVRFGRDYLGLEIGFSGFVNASLHHSSCGNTFNSTTLPHLGNQPTCSFLNSSFLQVTFGVNATLKGGMSLHFQPSSYVTNTSDCTSIPASDMHNVTLYEYPLLPCHAKLTTPSHVSLDYAEDLVLDGQASTGFLNRPGEFQWKISSEPAISNLSIYSSEAFFTGKSVVRIKARDLLPATLTVTLTVKNYLDEISTTSTTIVVSSSSVLHLSFTTPQKVTMTRAVSRSFTVVPDLNQLPSNPVFEYIWSLVRTEPEGTEVNLMDVGMGKPLANTLNVKQYSLLPETVYVFRVNVTERNTLLKGDLDLFINMTQNDIGVSLSQISGPVESYKPFTVSAIITDLDKLSQTEPSLTWICLNSTLNCSSEVKRVGNSLFFPENSVSSGSRFFISVNVTIFQKWTIKNGTFEAQDEPVPAVSLTCPTGKVTPTVSYRCIAGVTYTGTSLNYQWTLTKGAIEEFRPILDTALLVKAGDLVAGREYAFKFEVEYGLMRKKIATSVEIVTNSAPVNGVFAIFPQSGQELTTLFTLQAANWEDDDLPLTYSITYTLSEKTVKIKPRTESQGYTTMLPSGLSPLYRLTLVLSVWDAFSTAAERQGEVEVTGRSMNSSEVMSVLTQGLNVTSENLGTVPSTCTAVGPKVVTSNLTSDELTSAYRSVLDGLTQYSAIDPTSDYDSAADCLQVFSLSLGNVQSEDRKNTISLVTFLSTSSDNIDSRLGGKLLGSIGAVMNTSTSGELGLKDVENTIESIGNSMMTNCVPGEKVSIAEGGVTAQLEMMWSDGLNNADITVSGANATIQLPANISTDAGLTSTSIYQFSAYSLPGNTLNSSVLKVDLAASGRTIPINNLKTPINFTMYVSNSSKPADIKCRYYVSANDTWSTLGVQTVSVNSSTGLVKCATFHLSMFSAGVNSAVDTGEGSNIGELGNIDNFTKITDKNAAGIYVCVALWLTYLATGVYALILDRRNRDQASLTLHKEQIERNEPVTALQTSGLFIRQLQLKSANASEISQNYASQTEMSTPEIEAYGSSRTVTEVNVGESEVKTQGNEKKIVRNKPNVWEMILDEHMIVGILLKYNETFPRFNRLTIFVCMIMGELFLSGLFYDNDQGTGFTADFDSKKFSEAAKNYSWRDFWIAVYSSLLMIPIGLLLIVFLSRRKIEDIATSLNLKERTLKLQRIKKYLGYVVAWSLMLFFSYGIVVFSLAFDVSAMQWSVADLWMLTFGVATLQDLLLWTNVKLIMKVIILYILYKCY